MSDTFNITVQAGATVIIGGEYVTDEYDVVLDSTDNSGPMTQAQRSALFGRWTDAFGRDHGQRARHLFTAAVLGVDVDPSWSNVGSITANQADHLLRVLAVVNSLP